MLKNLFSNLCFRVKTESHDGIHATSDKLGSFLMSCVQYKSRYSVRRDFSIQIGFVSLIPSNGAKTPSIAFFQSWESPWSWRHQIVSLWLGKFKEFCCELGTGSVCTSIIAIQFAGSITSPTGHWICWANCKFVSVDILVIGSDNWAKENCNRENSCSFGHKSVSGHPGWPILVQVTKSYLDLP